MASSQAVVGNAFAEVMDAVEGNICRKPVQYRWEKQIAAAIQCSPEIAPAIRAVGIRAWKENYVQTVTI